MRVNIAKMTDAICLSGANLSQLEYLRGKKYISKKKMKELLDDQMSYLIRIEKMKDEILKLVI